MVHARTDTTAGGRMRRSSPPTFYLFLFGPFPSVPISVPSFHPCPSPSFILFEREQARLACHQSTIAAFAVYFVYILTEDTSLIPVVLKTGSRIYDTCFQSALVLSTSCCSLAAERQLLPRRLDLPRTEQTNLVRHCVQKLRWLPRPDQHGQSHCIPLPQHPGVLPRPPRPLAAA